ncbi:MAG: SidA/IucD/PvdA family monooxygenase [Solirubrobacteraceae bacterium]
MSPVRENPQTTIDSDLLVVGAGAKAAAIATKVHVLNTLGLTNLSMRIIEAAEPAASWLGRNGMTSGEEPLAVAPVKDVGFPYNSHQAFGAAGEEIDRAMMAFSWQQYLIFMRRYARWIDAGLPAVQHREYGRYLTWALSQATTGVQLLSARVRQLTPDVQTQSWLVEADSAKARLSCRCRAVVLTGPGVHRQISHDPGVAERIFHCDSRRVEFERIPLEQNADIAIIGGGESALSSLALLRGSRPAARFTVYTPELPMSRGESFLENRVFSDPDEAAWESLEPHTRRAFVKHGDRGVFDPRTLSEIAYDDRCRFVTGRVEHVGMAESGALIHYRPSGGAAVSQHDYVINCTGFDLLEQLRLLMTRDAREELQRHVGPLWGQPSQQEVPIGRHLELDGLRPMLHVPGLAGLSQGPGFANLGCLGILANRVLEPLIALESEPTSTRQTAVTRTI